MKADSPKPNTDAPDLLEGAVEIAKFLSGLGLRFDERRVYRARETGALPIRSKRGFGLYAFRSELLAEFKNPDTLTPDEA